MKQLTYEAAVETTKKRRWMRSQKTFMKEYGKLHKHLKKRDIRKIEKMPIINEMKNEHILDEKKEFTTPVNKERSLRTSRTIIYNLQISQKQKVNK